MKGKKKHIGMIVAGMVLVFFIAGCVSNKDERGRSVAQPRKAAKVTIQQLQNDFAKYNVYYSGEKPAEAVSVLFNPKNSDTTLTPDKWWVPVKDEKALANIVSWMGVRDEIGLATVQNIMGPGSKVFGYLYTYNYDTRLKVVSDTEMIVYAPVN